ncbi:MAG: hypothetical protein WD005_01190 [Haliea sp.]
MRSKLVRNADEYRYSGHRSYSEGRGSEVLEPFRVLEMLGGKARYRRFVQDGMEGGHQDEYYRVEDQRFLGPEGFSEKLKSKADGEEIARPKKPLMTAVRNAARELGIETEVLGGRDRSWETSRVRGLIGYVLIRRAGYPLKEVAKYLGRDMATVSSMITRLADRMDADEALREQAERLARIV